MKLHFHSDRYNYFACGGKTNANPNSFERRNDKSFFHVLGKKHNKKDLELFFGSNLMENDGLWIGEALEQNCRDTYLKYLGRKESLEYIFQQDLNKLKELGVRAPGALSNVKKHSLPLLITLTNQREVFSETCIILNLMFQLFDYWGTKIADNLLFQNFIKKHLKYSPFLGTMDLGKYHATFVKAILMQ